MFCSRCGSEVSNNAHFCPACGLDLTATTPVQGLATSQVTEFDVVREALAAEYDVLEEIGRGGMALVYRARDRHIEREVAVKVLPFSLAFDAEFVERFQREARTAGQLEHPNIVPIYRVGRAGRVTFFVMKYLRGGTLSDVLAERRRLDPGEIRRLLIDCGAALGYAAERGVVHRDIKPDNIMFDESGHCFLTDFGIAKASAGQRITGTGMSIGTPHYMSPEQARAQPTDGRSDLYSLGVVAYQCLVGTVPYDGEDSFSIGYRHVTEPLPAPVLRSADDRQLFDVIRRMLMKDPAERFQQADDMVEALHRQPVAPRRLLRRPAGDGKALSARGDAALMEQPTAPLEAAPVDRRGLRSDRRARPRRVDDRAPFRLAASRAWVWLLLAVLGGGAGAVYYYAVRGFAPAADSAGLADAPADTLAVDSPAVGTTSTGGRAAVLPVLPAIEPISADSGAIRILSPLPPQAMVYVDTLRVTAAVTRVPVGRRVVAVSAPGYGFWADTLVVIPGSTYDIMPELRPTPVP